MYPNSFMQYPATAGIPHPKGPPNAPYTVFYGLSTAYPAQGSTDPTSANSPHTAQQLMHAQLSRHTSSPHHHYHISSSRTGSPMPYKKTLQGTPAKTDKSRMSIVDSTLSTENEWSVLDLGGVGLKSIASVLFSYHFLTALYLNYNKLTTLAPCISKLVHLRELDASGNQLTMMPREMGLLFNLKSLLLFDNQLMTLPNEMGTLYQLETLGLEGNPLRSDLKCILMEQGALAVIASLRENIAVGAPPSEREWITIQEEEEETKEDSGTDSSPKDKFIVLCYNILCEKYATQKVYGYTPSWALAWDYRKDIIMAEIAKWNPDIICLQEVEMGLYEDTLREELREMGNYESVFYPKSRAKTMSQKEKRSVDGCATFYRVSKFSLVEDCLLEFNCTALQRQDFKKTEDFYNRVMTKDNISVMTVLQTKKTFERVLVANSHIHWDPSFADVKLVQVGILMEELKRIASKHLSADKGPTYASVSKLPTVICGDFNSESGSGVYELLSKGSIQQDHCDFGEYKYGHYTTQGVSHAFSLKSAYHPIGELPFTNYTPQFKGVLDYIWHSSNALDVMALVGKVDHVYAAKTVGFPDAHFPSDHIPLIAELKIRVVSHKTMKPNFGPQKHHSNSHRPLMAPFSVMYRYIHR
ncbi:Endonuclease/exonuclease/phosphatase [Spinellus fusiger]|nr:Endonuclease/exonuclease/phosphatase [Spinellus fusiger]